MKKYYLDPATKLLLRRFLIKPDGTPIYARILTKGVKGKLAASTRTVTSLQDAFTAMGGISEWMPLELSSMAKGESAGSTARNIASRIDCIAIRDDGDAKTPQEMADSIEDYGLDCLVINLGNANQWHPLQTLADLYTLQENKPKEFYSGKLRIALIGDLPYSRTIKSLLVELRLYGGEVFLVAPKGWELPDDVLSGLDCSKLKIKRVTNLLSIASYVEALYFTRLQKNLRGEDPSEQQMQEFLKTCSANEQIRSAMRPDAIALHPQPAGPEFDDRLDLVDTRFTHHRQSDNKFYTSMALLKMLFAPNVDIKQIASEYGKVEMSGFFHSIPVNIKDIIGLCCTKNCACAELRGNGWEGKLQSEQEKMKVKAGNPMIPWTFCSHTHCQPRK